MSHKKIDAAHLPLVLLKGDPTIAFLGWNELPADDAEEMFGQAMAQLLTERPDVKIRTGYCMERKVPKLVLNSGWKDFKGLLELWEHIAGILSGLDLTEGKSVHVVSDISVEAAIQTYTPAELARSRTAASRQGRRKDVTVSAQRYPGILLCRFIKEVTVFYFSDEAEII